MNNLLEKYKVEPINEQLVYDLDKLPQPTLTNGKLTFDLSPQLKEFKENAPVPPAVRFSDLATNKMQALVGEYNKELAWHGIVHKDEEGFLVTDVIVYPQVTTATTVDADEDKYAMWVATLEDEQFNGLRLQGHSHVNMACFPSGTDEDYYKDLVKQVQDYYIVVILNKKNDLFVRYYDIENNLIYENNTSIEFPEKDWAAEQISQHVKAAFIPAYGKTKTLKPYNQKNFDYLNEQQVTIFDADDELPIFSKNLKNVPKGARVLKVITENPIDFDYVFYDKDNKFDAILEAIERYTGVYDIGLEYELANLNIDHPTIVYSPISGHLDEYEMHEKIPMAFIGFREMTKKGGTGNGYY